MTVVTAQSGQDVALRSVPSTFIFKSRKAAW